MPPTVHRAAHHHMKMFTSMASSEELQEETRSSESVRIKAAGIRFSFTVFVSDLPLVMKTSHAASEAREQRLAESYVTHTLIVSC